MTPAFDPAALALRVRMLCDMHGGVDATAKACGLVSKTLRNTADMVSVPNAATLASLCHAFDVSADWLLFGEKRQ